MAAAAGLMLVAFLLWPTWADIHADDPADVPVSVGATIFDVPSRAIRVKVQRHSGPQERVDLNFEYPSLQPPQAIKRVTAATMDEKAPPTDRLFLSIAAHHDVMAPEVRAATIYPRYFDPNSTTSTAQAGLLTRPFRDTSPYSGEDFVSADSPAMTGRCTRESETPGTCISERRVGGADLTFRFPRSWLENWPEVAAAMDKLTAQIQPASARPAG